ncbi:hypothetical protein ZOSMA_294G00030 [Zostera marina]|uniref:Uncharacterized protein n=1 Tax=Zostera marina TaxID=29655 RepID=A0A0K9PE81_ZOSMR|nr:hypothetical protein ZOSMA_294G00030 [Zostera marina]
MMMKKTAVVCERDESVGSRTRQLELDLRRVKDSEIKMLESLMSQTKQLAETKIELEEAKLEIGNLHDTIRSTRSVPKGKHFDSDSDLEFSQQEIARLKNELQLAIGAEEKSKKAMDDLAAALKEVAWESNQAKEKLLVVETQLLDKRSEVESSKADLRETEEELAKALEKIRSMKMEMGESAIRWNAEQEGVKACLRLLEDEIKVEKEENAKLIEAEKGWRSEVSNMRDIMKHALKEATLAKEALEIGKSIENSTTNSDSDGGKWVKNNVDIRSESVRYPPSYSQRPKKDTKFGSFSGQRTPILRHNINNQTAGLNVHSPSDNSNSKSPRCSKADQKKKHMFRKFADILRRRSK